MNFTVLGGGVVGLSTALVLETLGHETRLVTERVAYLDGTDHSGVATNYAAASVYPAYVEADASHETLLRRAVSTFEPFAEVESLPLCEVPHYQLSESGDPSPSPALSGVRSLADHGDTPPSRPGETVAGFVADRYLVDMPSYVPLLVAAYRGLGGTISRRQVTRDDIPASADGEYVVNCTGYGSRRLFDDESMVALKGHILEVGAPDPPVEFSYNYAAAEYDEGVYMYPRGDRLLFGGSHLAGQVVDGEWVGETPDRSVTLDGEQLPERVWTVNRAITGRELTEADVTVRWGYRPYQRAGLRIEREGDVLHNYGHGGGGVALSWWSALELAGLVCDVPADTLETVATRLGQVAKK